MPDINPGSGKYLFYQGNGITSKEGIIEGEFTGFRYLIADYKNYASLNSIVLVIKTQVELQVDLVNRWITIDKNSHWVGCTTGKRSFMKIDLLDSEYFKNSISYFVNVEPAHFDLTLTLIP